ncbi:MAG: plastocyanin/azurin family copper-binding protein [Gemmatimonadales bacterium]
MWMVSGRRVGFVVLVAMAGAGCNGDSGPSQSQLKMEKAPTKSGDEQTGLVGTKLGNDLRVFVTRDAQPVNGATVAWFTSEGSVNPTSSISDPDGIATTGWTLGTTIGIKAATATILGAQGSPLAFTAQAVVTTPPTGGTVVINVLGPDGANRFEPSEVTVLPGTTVSWIWSADAKQHNVVPDDGSVPETSGVLADGPHAHTYQFNTLGAYRFYCANHGGAGGVGMSGTVNVVDQQ